MSIQIYKYDAQSPLAEEAEGDGMSDERTPEQHKKHLCYMVARGGILMEEGLKSLKDLVSEANFVCETCGRAATKAENLCHPIKL